MLSTTKRDGRKMFGLNEKSYGSLLQEYLPRVITSEEENEETLYQIEGLMMKPEKTPEEEALYLLLVKLAEDFEAREYEIVEALPQEVLQHLMEERGVKQKDLIGIIGSKGVVSEVINGKRAVSKEQAKNLGAFFGVSPLVFI
jgi:HTH-type transcriptional regulator / antitoxin HigA